MPHGEDVCCYILSKFSILCDIYGGKHPAAPGKIMPVVEKYLIRVIFFQPIEQLRPNYVVSLSG
jgi:hypothetical protein